MKHYHVMVSPQGGYLPNVNDVYRTKGDAEQGLRWFRDQARDNGERVTGSIRAGLITLGEHEYAELFRCDDPECCTELEVE